MATNMDEIHNSSEEELDRDGCGQRIEHSRYCDRGCRYGQSFQLSMANRGEDGPRFIPAGPSVGVMHYASDSMGWACAVMFSCHKCLNVPIQLDIC